MGHMRLPSGPRSAVPVLLCSSIFLLSGCGRTQQQWPPTAAAAGCSEMLITMVTYRPALVLRRREPAGPQVYRHKARRGEHVLVARTPRADFVGHTNGADRTGPPACMCASRLLFVHANVQYFARRNSLLDHLSIDVLGGPPPAHENAETQTPHHEHRSRTCTKVWPLQCAGMRWGSWTPAAAAAPAAPAA